MQRSFLSETKTSSSSFDSERVPNENIMFYRTGKYLNEYNIIMQTTPNKIIKTYKTQFSPQ